MSSSTSETRVRIVDACIDLLENGAAPGIRMSDIAAAAGISRQAVYLHFRSRADLLDAATQRMDERLDLEGRLATSRNAATGTERLNAYIEFWGNYVPQIYGVAKSLLDARAQDDDARAAWNERMQALRHGCRAAIAALANDGQLAERWSVDAATDMLWTFMSVENWRQLTEDCGWSRRRYIEEMQRMARQVFIAVPA